jgi:hypothetical protein
MQRRSFALVAALIGAQTASAFSAAVVRISDPDEVLVVGIVLAAYPADALLTIRQANLLGNLRFETRSYRVKQGSSLAGLRSGDRITAVLSAKDRMLHQVTRLRNRQAAKDK